MMVVAAATQKAGIALILFRVLGHVLQHGHFAHAIRYIV
jgi:hypothetical protein